MNKHLKFITLFGVILSVLFSVTLAPVQSVYAESGNTEASLKKVLYASAVYSCATNYGGLRGFFQQVAKGDKISSIFPSESSYSYYIGTGYGLSSSGTISCREAAEKLFGAQKIGDGSLGDNGVLKGVYEYSSSGEKKISCQYGIINSQKSGLIQNNKLFYWPAGYYDGLSGHVNMTNHGKISVVYDDSGPIRLEGATSDVNVEHALESMRQYSIDWKHDDKICKNLVQYTEIYSFEAQNAFGETITAYEPIRSNTTDSVGGSWILNGGNTADAAWLNTASPAGFYHEVETATDSTKLLPTSDAGARLAANIQQEYLDGSAGLSAFLADHPDARYLLYGRYLFNGDGGYSGGCAGTVVLDKDIDPQKMDTTYWDTSLSYVETFTAWKNARTKETYRVKFGGNGIASAGHDVDVILPGQEYIGCSALVSKLSTTTNSVSTATPKTTVYKYMGVTDVEDLPEENDPVPGSGNNGDGGANNVTVSECIEAAGALGWIMCPVLDIASEATASLYGYIQNNFLWIGNDVMGTNKETHQAWKQFRDYANVVFIVVFLVVILSQITGFGISNYGVKKILPRLIAVVLLTNLSFIICQLAVDLSDIVGAGLNTALSSLGGIAEAKDADYGVSSIIAGARSALGFASITTTGGAAIAIGAVTWRIWLLPLLLAVIGALVGVFMFFLSLAIREAGIIILVVLCPVAIVCYALPNTKKIFDKWFRIFTSLLMVYPICGLLMGGGQFASSLLVKLSTDNEDAGFMLTLTAMLLSVVPFFFIPTIVRTSLNAIGQLGARISNFGRGIGGRLTGAIRGSERFKDAQRELATQRDENFVRRLDRRAERRIAKGKDGYTASAQRRRARAYARADKVRREELLGQSYNDRGLLSDDEVRREQLLGNLADKDFTERVAGAKVDFRKDPAMATEEAIVKKHNELLEQFGNDPKNIQLQSQLRALEEMAMEKGAPGQDLLQQSFARYMTNNKGSWNDNKEQAISKLSAGLATRYGKELNGSDKGFNTMMNHFAEGNFKNLSSFSGDDASGYSSSYDTKLAGFTAAGMNKATPGALQRGLAALQSGAFSSGDAKKDAELKAQAQTMITNATQALNDELIANDLKPTEKGFVQGIASYGASMRGSSGVITSLGQGSLENLAQFVDNTSDTNALMQLGQNIQDAAGSSHLYGEGETSRLKMIINKINSKAGTSYTFNPTSMQINQGGQQQQSPIVTGTSPEEAARLKAEADKKILGR